MDVMTNLYPYRRTSKNNPSGLLCVNEKNLKLNVRSSFLSHLSTKVCSHYLQTIITLYKHY